MGKESMAKLITYLHKLKLNLSHYYILRDTLTDVLPNHTLTKQLERGGFVYGGEVTSKGKDLLKSVLDKEYLSEKIDTIIKEKKKVEYTKEFLEWWDAFPSTDIFEIDNMKFEGTRSMRASKEKCNEVYSTALKEYSHPLLIGALKSEVELRMRESVLKSENQISYMKGTISYLNSENYKLYLGRNLSGREEVRRVKNFM